MNNLRRVYALIRHGDYYQQPGTPSALQPHGLTPSGVEQANQAATMIENYAHYEGLALSSFIHTSTSRRAWETGANLAQALGFEDTQEIITTSDEITERSVGALANLTAEEIETIIADDPRFEAPPQHWKSDSHYCLPVPGAESLLQSGKRVANYLTRLDQLPNNQNELVIIVGHGASMRHAAFHLGILEFEDIAKLSMFHAQPVFIENTPLGWQKVGGEWKVRTKKTEFTD